MTVFPALSTMLNPFFRDGHFWTKIDTIARSCFRAREDNAMFSKRMLVLFFAVTLQPTCGLADGSTKIIARKACMKASASAMTAMHPIFRGEKSFEAEAIETALERAEISCREWNEFWPIDSQSSPGIESRSAPAIWSDVAGFQRASETYLKARAALAQSKDEASFKVNFQAVGAACGACHETYRTPDN